MEALFEIFDSDNDGYFGLNDLITLLRTYETSQIVPQLRSHLQRNNEFSENSDSHTDASSDKSSKSVMTAESDDSIPEIILDTPEYITSKKMKKIATKMMKDCGFDSDSFLNFEEFAEFISKNSCFQNSVILATHPELWSQISEIDLSSNKSNSRFQNMRSVIMASGINLRKHSRVNSISESTAVGENGYFSKLGDHLISGALRKKGRKSGGLKKRFYVIKGNFMYYFSKNSDVLPSGVMFLPNKLFQQTVINGKHCIKVFTYDSSFMHKVFYASYKEECSNWMEAMLKASNNSDILNKYKMKETLGVGKFSTVRKAYLKSDESKTFAIKIVSKSTLDEKEREYILNELSVLKTINHPNIPKVFSFHETHEKMYIVMEHIEGGELFDYLVDSDSLPYDEALLVTHKLVKVLKYLKECKVMHRDVKTENILITKNGRRHLKKIYLIDFGLARYLDSREKVNSKVGTMGYCAPEVITKDPYNESVDVWAVGVVLYLLLVGKLPFHHKSDSTIAEKTVKEPVSFIAKVFDEIDSKVQTFISRALMKKQIDRLTIEEALSLCVSLRN
jgi:tRNA A-37 threonylcarbamoyl transferase component Bud32/Ca2+-binding EF-hand superfamily protein